jgi:selenocysteine lyase/cysteine desulfurase
MNTLESFFDSFRSKIIGANQRYSTPYGEQQLVYLDWVASGRLYEPIEQALTYQFGPFIGNTHTETSETGTLMTESYRYAREIIKRHVNAGEEDVVLYAGFGMTAAVNKLQRIIGLKGCATLRDTECLKQQQKPVVFVTHMEHHSNHTSWYETNADVVVLNPTPDLLVDPEDLSRKLMQYADREIKIGSFTACSNVTGIEAPYHELARIMHEHDGLCFVDFAASAPYAEIDMHPEDPAERLDAIFFSPHKFLGGPGTSGEEVFNRTLDKNPAPDQPGGGTVDWTNPWGEYKYVDDLELREDGGTPGFLQAIRTALAIKLKEEMGTERIRRREGELFSLLIDGLQTIDGIHILADHIERRLGIVSIFHETIHYNLIVALLSDRFGIQVRGGCVCAGTYGHYLLHVTRKQSKQITERINAGDRSEKPGWVRISLHPTTTDAEIRHCIDALGQIVEHHLEWSDDYLHNVETNEYIHKTYAEVRRQRVVTWFSEG